LRLLLQDLDRCVWIFGQRCKKITSLNYRSQRKFNEFIYPNSLLSVIVKLALNNKKPHCFNVQKDKLLLIPLGC
jgi:hypothetical protein